VNAVNGGDLLTAERERITRAEFARRLGISKAGVTQGVSKGRLAGAALADGTKLWWPEAARQWRRSADPQAELKDQPAAQAPTAAAAKADAEVADLPAYRDERARKARIDADLAQIELDRKRDQYRDRDEVQRAIVTCGRSIRQAIDGLELYAGELAQAHGADPDALRRDLRRIARMLQQRAADAVAQHMDGDPAEAELDALAADGAGDPDGGDDDDTDDTDGTPKATEDGARHAVNA
jgi:hypothetical protein